MVDPGARPAPPTALSDADQSSFGLNRSDAEWLEIVRAAEPPIELGRVGPYELLGVAGTGGQGVVYRARQPNTGRDVALKRLLAGPLAGDTARDRFRREIEVDAALRHPNIVTVYGVEIIDGQPLLAMEWIDGAPIDRWASGADGARPVPEILAVFLKVCDGVQHAHQRGVIHRDLKPSNILVDERGEPRVLDFGLARIADPGTPSRLTVTGGFIGTLAYAAPEQVRGDPGGGDVRTDVYALGGILFQCLTGRAPFAGVTDLAALTRAICETDPPRPSSLRRGLDTDLDAIIGKALAKDPAARYPTVDALATDIRRHIEHQPIAARRPSAAYHLRKFARRHRAAVGAAIVAVVLASAGVAYLVSQWRRANTAAEIAQAVNEFLNEDLLASADPASGLGERVTVRDVLDNAARAVEGHFPGRPLVEAGVRLTIGNAYSSLGQYAAAETHLRRAVDLRRDTLGPGDEETRIARCDLAAMLSYLERFDEAEAILVEALEARQRRLGPDAAATILTLHRLGQLRAKAGRLGEAEPMLAEASRRAERTLPADAPDALNIRLEHAGTLLKLGRAPEAEAIMLPAFESLRRVRGPTHPDTIAAVSDVSKLHRDMGRFAQADSIETESIENCGRILGPNHPSTLVALNNRAVHLQEHGRFAESEPVLRRILDVQGTLLGEEHRDTLATLHNLAALCRETGRLTEAEPLARRAAGIAERRLTPDEPFAQAIKLNLALVHQRMNRPGEAERLYRELIEVQRQTLEPGHTQALATINNLALLLRNDGRAAEAESLLRPAIDDAEKTLGRDSLERGHMLNALALAVDSQGRTDEAITLYREILRARRATLGNDHPSTAVSMGNLATALTAKGEYEEAESLYTEAGVVFLAKYGPDHPSTGINLRQFGVVFARTNRLADAERALREALRIDELDGAPPDYGTLGAMNDLAHVLTEQAAADPNRAASALPEAEQLLLTCVERLDTPPTRHPQRRREAAQRLVRVYEVWGRADQADETRARLVEAEPQPQP